ncbi:MAG: hypothetical protein NQU46_04670 [Methanolinea sp.]|nr:hypothetical protein [Methanolinea sp.]
MDARLLDIFVAVCCFIVLLILVLVLPAFLPAGIAYLLALVIFIFAMSAAGFSINKALP